MEDSSLDFKKISTWRVHNFGARNEKWIRDFIRVYPDLFAELERLKPTRPLINRYTIKILTAVIGLVVCNLLLFLNDFGNQ